MPQQPANPTAPPAAEPQQQRMSIPNFVSGVREHVDVPDDMDDATLMRQLIQADPGIKDLVEGSVPRRRLPESAASRFTMGYGEQPYNMAKDTLNRAKHLNEGADYAGGVGPLGQMRPKPGLPTFDAAGIKKDIGEGNYAGAAGRGAQQASQIGFMALGAKGAKAPASTLGEMEDIGAGSEVNKAMLDVAKTVTKPHSMALDAAITKIDTGMSSKFINSQRASAGIAYAAKVLKKQVSRAPDTALGDVTAAREAVLRIEQKIKANPKNMPWTDARQLIKEVDAAKQQVGPGAARNALEEVSTAMKEELQTSADAAGYGQAFKNWTADYRSLARGQRAYAKVLKGQTAAQAETKITAKSGPNISILGSRIQRSKGTAIANTNREMLQKAHGAFKELDSRIKQEGRYEGKPVAPSPQEIVDRAQTQAGESGTEQLRRGSSGTPPKAKVENQVPKGKRASDQIANGNSDLMQKAQQVLSQVNKKYPPEKIIEALKTGKRPLDMDINTWEAIQRVRAKPGPGAANVDDPNFSAAAPEKAMESAAKAVEAGGGVFKGRYGFAKMGMPEQLVVNDPVTGTTIAVPEEGVTAEIVRQAIKQSRAKFGVK